MKRLSAVCVLVWMLAVASVGAFGATTLTFTEVDVGGSSQVDLTDQFTAYGVVFDHAYRYIDSRDPWPEMGPQGGPTGYGIAAGWIADINTPGATGTIHFAVPTPYVTIDWWTITGVLYADAYDGGDNVVASFSGSGFGTATLSGSGSISYLRFHDSGGYVAISTMTFEVGPRDCNGNGVPDETDVANGTSQDCNRNRVPDECDVAPGGASTDANGNGIPDECDLRCPDVPALECTETAPCDTLSEELRCPEDASITADEVTVEPAENALCGGASLRVFHVREGSYVTTESSSDDVCDSACYAECRDSCARIPIQECYEVCVRRCGNGACLQWETQCEVVRYELLCDERCFTECEAHHDPGTQTSFYTRDCGGTVDDDFEIRAADGGCTGTLFDSVNVRGYGTAGATIAAPVTPGSYELCLGGVVRKTFAVTDCGAACRLEPEQTAFLLQRGVDAALGFVIESVPRGGSYALSLHRWYDDAHTIPMVLPPFLSAPPSVSVPDGDVAAFDLAAVNPQPQGDQTHWGRVIVRAEGPATCEALFDLDVLFNQPPEVGCVEATVPTDAGVCLATLPCEQIATCTDPDGDAVSLTCVPAGPYGVGATNVAVRCDDGTVTSELLCPIQVEDQEPPSGEITGPQDNGCFGPTAVPVSVTDSFADNCSSELIRQYQPGPGPSYSSHGDHDVSLRVTDEYGNTASDSVTFVIDLVAPSVGIINPQDRTYLVPSTLPLGVVFRSGDDDRATGGVVHEVMKLAGCTIFDGNTYGDNDGLLSDESVQLTQGALCSVFRKCGFTTLNQPELRIEATDCGGNVGVAARTFRGGLALLPGICGR